MSFFGYARCVELDGKSGSRHIIVIAGPPMRGRWRGCPSHAPVSEASCDRAGVHASPYSLIAKIWRITLARPRKSRVTTFAKKEKLKQLLRLLPRSRVSARRRVRG